MRIEVNILGSTHKSVATKLLNLAGINSWLGQYRIAEQMARNAIAIFETALGHEHPQTRLAMSVLAQELVNQKAYEEAESVYLRIVKGLEKSPESAGQELWKYLCSLALVAQESGKSAEAAEYYARALSQAEKAFGPKHEVTVESLDKLGSILQQEGRHAEAEQHYRRALSIREDNGTKNHPLYLKNMNALVAVLSAQEKYSEAEKLLQEFVDDEERLNPSSATLALSISTLADFQNNNGMKEAAEATRVRAKAVFRSCLGDRNVDERRLDEVLILAETRLREKDLSGAESSYLDVLASVEETFGIDSMQAASLLARLALCAAEQNKLGVVRTHYNRCLKIYEKNLPYGHGLTVRLLENMSSIARRTGNEVEARALQNRADEMKHNNVWC